MCCRILLSILLFWGLIHPHASAQEGRPVLHLQEVMTNGWFKFGLSHSSEMSYAVEQSIGFSEWTPIAILSSHWSLTNPVLPYIDPASTWDNEAKFYRVRAFPTAPTNDWKNQAIFPEDPFLSERTIFDVPETRWIKFAITTNEPTRVYYQDSTKYEFHYNFATARLPEFQGLTPTAFDQLSLHTNGQKVVLGTLLFAPTPGVREIGVQFVGMDPYPPADVVKWFDLVRSTIVSDDEVKLFYLPSFEQSGTAESNRDFFAAHGVEISSLARWDSGNSCYSFGWALGTLKYFPPGSVQTAYASGALLPGDILLTDSVPAELPYLSGILTLNPATPNSHVAILARSYGVPFAWLASEELQELAQNLIGKDVILSAQPAFPGGRIELIDASALSPEVREEIVRLKRPAPIQITPKETLGQYTANTDELYPKDIKFFGGKASNFGFIRRQVPTNSPVAIAISFDLWDDFMNQAMPSGKTLREEINSRLSKYSYPPPVGQLEIDLQAIRDLIEDETVFTTAQQEAIATALLGHFDPQRKIRFRSSTNVEDSESFTGAGLYDSYSGCLADDQDADNTGPSICDPTEDKERGVFRAIRKVYASFYNNNAVLERMRHGVDEADVGMAILVHHSSPDETEMANGVATIRFNKHPMFSSFEGEMVTQKGAVSVTNPDNSAIPEVIQLSRFSTTTYPSVEQWSSLMPLGATVLEWEKEYRQFGDLFASVAEAFQDYHTNKTVHTLDFEFKKIVPGSLMVKQVREIPQPNNEIRQGTVLVNNPGAWSVFQGEFGDIFGNHRLKSRFQLVTRDLKLVASNLASTIFREITFEYLDGQNLKTLEGNPSSFPDAEHKVLPADPYGLPVTDSWAAPITGGSRRFTLTTSLKTEVGAAEMPVLTLDDMSVELSEDYDHPLPSYQNGILGETTQDYVRLVPAPTTNEMSIPVTRTVSGGTNVTLTISFYWPEPPSGATAGYTAPLAAWKQTEIVGLTSEPIILRGYYSQTYRPEHHNFAERFLFEPRLEEGIPPSIITELEAQNIRQILVYWGGADDQSEISLIDANGNIRPLDGVKGRQ